VPIREFLNGENFDPETTHAIGVAFEIACVALQLRNRSDPASTAMVAEKIIALTKAGERCITALSDRALSELGYSTGGADLSPPLSHKHPRARRARVSEELCARPGFGSTALHFERLALKETHDNDRRQRLLEVAGFYRSLAEIIPGMPIEYKNNEGSKPPFTRAQRFRSRAEECRTLADCFTSPICRKQLTELAQSYEHMAVAAE
jgi:hypothetical protein